MKIITLARTLWDEFAIDRAYKLLINIRHWYNTDTTFDTQCALLGS